MSNIKLIPIFKPAKHIHYYKYHIHTHTHTHTFHFEKICIFLHSVCVSYSPDIQNKQRLFS